MYILASVGHPYLVHYKITKMNKPLLLHQWVLLDIANVVNASVDSIMQ